MVGSLRLGEEGQGRGELGREQVVGVQDFDQVAAAEAEAEVDGLDLPGAGLAVKRTRGSDAASAAARRAVPSAEPSSTMTSSQSRTSWAWRLRTDASI